MRLPITKTQKAPITLKRADLRRTHGDTRSDEYAWLEKNGPDAQNFLNNEQRYASSIMTPTAKLQKKLYKEIRTRISENDMSVPEEHGPYRYYTKMKKGKQYAIHCRKALRGGREEVILDENELAVGHSFFALGVLELSSDHTKLAYTVDTKGDERHTLYIKDLGTGSLLKETISDVASVAWAHDDVHLFYSKERHPHPPRQLFIHELFRPASTDMLIFEEHDPACYVGVTLSRSEEYIFVDVGNFDFNEVWVIPSRFPLTKPQCLARRKKQIRYAVEHHGPDFYIMTNELAVNYKVYVTSVGKLHRKDWRLWMPQSSRLSLTALIAFKNCLVITAREEGAEWMYLTPYDSPRLERLPLPESEHSIGIHDGIEYASDCIRYSYSSFVTPRTVYDYHILTKRLVLRKRQKAPGWNPNEYISERLWARNGPVAIPISLCYKKSLRKKGKTSPLLLEVYGSYGITNDPYYSVARTSLLERGWIIAIAHPRGGGEMGWGWHKAAKLQTKHRTYEDVIACAKELIKKNYTSATQMVLTGGSAGGMTAGAVLNMRPDLFKGAVVYVPNADTVTSMLDTSLGGTVMHYDELGDPRKKKDYRYLKKWSPYENVKKMNYPTMLVRASVHDIRTPYWEAAKWVSRLRARKRDQHPIILKIENNGGHGGKSGRYEWIKEKAYDYAFLLKMLG